MADDKKDMTGLMDFAKAQQDAGKAPPPPAGSVMEEQRIEKVDDFESLEAYSKTNPAPEPAPESAFETTPPEEVPAPDHSAAADNSLPSDEAAFVTTQPEPPTGFEGMDAGAAEPSPPSEDFPVTPAAEDHPPPLPGSTASGMSVLQAPVVSSHEPTFSPGGDDLSALQSNPETGAVADLGPPVPQESMSKLSAMIAPPPAAGAERPTQSKLRIPAPTSAPQETQEGVHSQVMPPSDEPQAAEAPPVHEPLRPASKTPSAPKKTLEKVKQFSEQMSPGREAVPAAFPFSLMITGMLEPEEKERLTDLLARENMGFRELDLEPQFEAGKILIPRISEYAGIMLVSALRSARAKIRLGPSDSIYATVDTQDSSEEDLESSEHQVEAYATDNWHPAEEVRITTEDSFPGSTLGHAIVDIVTASAALKTMVVQAENSPEYQMLLEALQREIKYKAFRKGATAIVNFSVSLTQLHMPMHYRVMVTGSAIK